ncbi:MAG: hypothetical protein LKK10_11010 [Prevotella sp.]|jgi:hypothetical protein|nr:hypothetical protein [Prevotella sp.]MCI2088788.1 hypothetical protein [Prevotella sp.]
MFYEYVSIFVRQGVIRLSLLISNLQDQGTTDLANIDEDFFLKKMDEKLSEIIEKMYLCIAILLLQRVKELLRPGYEPEK